MPNIHQMVIFTQTYDLLCWLLPCCEQFPKSQRFVLTARLQGAALDFNEAIYAANAEREETRLQWLRKADGHLNTLRLYLRLAQQFEWLRPGQYLHVSKMVNEAGRLLGGWIRQTQHSIAAAKRANNKAGERREKGDESDDSDKDKKDVT